ncbi:hypothetical protein GA0074695_5222 [Micromonospora viridifaciens]|uniref:SMI1/KNR4 family protein n=1 Tax=Micromonospora viridifaciens TaxID=1881 RepID=A0A1C4Z837_MICVI|nr:hypothetical protein [Micromonospora viridifaciens]SCF29129.1 hypothetical protein GA0074695_5222 [Micromonospora viridifaciens]
MTDNDELAGTLAEIRDKVELLRRVEAEHGFGVVIGEAQDLEPIPGLPAGVIEVFSVFRRLQGNYFCFLQPEEIGSRTAWERRPPTPPEAPLGEALAIGYGIRGIPAELLDEMGPAGRQVSLDVAEGYVYYIDGDDLADYYHSGEDVVVQEFAGDIAGFFNDWVLGADYPELVETILGADAASHRIPKGKDAGEYSDTWRRLLVTAGLAS